MLGNFIGQFDFPSALVVLAICGTIALITSAFIYRKKPVEYQLEAKKAEFTHQENVGNIAAKRDIELAKTSQNLITSHNSRTVGDDE